MERLWSEKKLNELEELRQGQCGWTQVDLPGTTASYYGQGSFAEKTVSSEKKNFQIQQGKRKSFFVCLTLTALLSIVHVLQNELNQMYYFHFFQISLMIVELIILCSNQVHFQQFSLVRIICDILT